MLEEEQGFPQRTKGCYNIIQGRRIHTGFSQSLSLNFLYLQTFSKFTYWINLASQIHTEALKNTHEIDPFLGPRLQTQQSEQKEAKSLKAEAKCDPSCSHTVVPEDAQQNLVINPKEFCKLFWKEMMEASKTNRGWLHVGSGTEDMLLFQLEFLQDARDISEIEERIAQGRL